MAPRHGATWNKNNHLSANRKERVPTYELFHEFPVFVPWFSWYTSFHSHLTCEKYSIMRYHGLSHFSGPMILWWQFKYRYWTVQWVYIHISHATSNTIMCKIIVRTTLDILPHKIEFVRPVLFESGTCLAQESGKKGRNLDLSVE